jgi:hypothetical protein
VVQAAVVSPVTSFQVTEAVGHLAPVFLGVEQVTTGPEVWGYPAERGQKPLRVPC